VPGQVACLIWCADETRQGAAALQDADALARRRGLEHFHKCCSGADTGVREAVFLTFDIVSAQSQGYANLLLRQSLVKSQKSSLRSATSFLSML